MPSSQSRRPHFKTRLPLPPEGDLDPAPEPAARPRREEPASQPHQPPATADNWLSMPARSLRADLSRPASAPARGETERPLLTPRSDRVQVQPAILTHPKQPPIEDPTPAAPSAAAAKLAAKSAEPAAAWPPESWRKSSSSGTNRGRGGRILLGLLLLAAGLGGGYWWGVTWPVSSIAAAVSPAPRPTSVVETPTASPERLTPSAQLALDAAFTALKSDRPEDARSQFAELLRLHPGWPMLALEEARAAMYQHDGAGSKVTLDENEKAGRIAPVDASFFSGLLRMAANDFQAANNSFGRAAAGDPTRADIFYFWGECLRRQGKPAEAVDRLRSALLRNQYETADGLYQLKLWLSEIQASTENDSGSGAAIDAELASPQPRGYALMAAAARDIRAEKYADAATKMRKATVAIDPPVMRLILHDPTFSQESWRPELAEFFPGSKAAKP